MIRATIALTIMLHAAATQAQGVPPAAPPSSPGASSSAPPSPAAPAAAPSFALDPPIFPIGPIGAWALDRDIADSCAASRNYGSAERPVNVTIKLRPDQMGLSIYIVSAATGGEPGSGKGAVTLKPGISTAADYSSFDLPVRDQHFTVLSVDRPAFDGLAGAQMVTIQGDRTIMIAAADMKEAIDTTDRCLVALYRSWGIDPAQFGYGKPAPTPSGGGLASWFDPAEYPAAERKAGIPGRVVMVLDVGKDGMVKACHVVVSAGAAFDAVSCLSVMKRASFTPAMDPHGKPLASWAIIPVTWKIQ